MKRKSALPALLLVPVAALAVACSSSPPAKVSGTETLSGTATGKTVIADSTQYHLTLAGPVNTTSTWSTPAGTQSKVTTTFTTPKGNLVLTATVKGLNSPPVSNAKTCAASFTISGTFVVDGSKSTGSFKDATGHGTVRNVASVVMPKLASGKCNNSENAQPLTAGAKATIVITGPMTVTP